MRLAYFLSAIFCAMFAAFGLFILRPAGIPVVSALVGAGGGTVAAIASLMLLFYTVVPPSSDSSRNGRF